MFATTQTHPVTQQILHDILRSMDTGCEVSYIRDVGTGKLKGQCKMGILFSYTKWYCGPGPSVSTPPRIL